ncbi:hypothetical protein FK531_14275 [Rhodococcus spelaei]|uniref:Uncharacterized protein n=1 Tax=Rhodococcus spelaei TaxID=2546320 RepID=A0A541B7J2_9NOCA|nr:phage tail protein [Rhodococcus spelaei]TQF68270.1 hypothetical protein FK531_14275 [Rhodococcus spelaei]
MTGTPVADGYADLYADKLWSLVPAAHRAADSTTGETPGPLQELLRRVAAQVADIHRSLDRLWEDQSIETCDSWVIPYIAQLLATNLVASMDARGQRLDVANTIYYRRRKGTVALLEQLAADVTGFDARVVEFFRSLGRTRHGLDPEIGRPADDTTDPTGARQLQHAEGLAGLLTHTPSGGLADLRNPLGATLTGTAFDEFHHRLDARRGVGARGWYGISKVGFFLWRTVSLQVDRATPVPVAGCPNHYSFDPTGRQIPLFQAAARSAGDYGEHWLPQAAWQLPAPITGPLWDALADEAAPAPGPLAYPDPHASLWPASVSVRAAGAADPLDLSQVLLWPEVGRFAVAAGPADVEVGYHHGLFSRIGAGPYDRRQLGTPARPDPAPVQQIVGGSATTLPAALAALGGTGTVIVADGLTLSATAPVGSASTPIVDVTVRAADQRRAVIRTAAGAGPWIFTGAPAGTPPARLRLEGMLLSGSDLVLRGRFDDVTLSCCTIDPGTGGNLRRPATVWEPGVDGRELSPSTIWIEGAVRSLTLDRCITGPIRTRYGGLASQLTAQNSIVQGLPTALGPDLVNAPVFDADTLVSALHHRGDPLTDWLAGQLSPAAAAVVAAHVDAAPVADLQPILNDLQKIIDGPLLWTADRFADRPLRASTQTAVISTPTPTGEPLRALNRELLAEAYPLALADAAIATDAGTVTLDRCTMLGAAYLHRLQCSETILDDVVRVNNAQDGCVRFSVWTTDSALPRRYESAQVPAGSPIFVSRRYGEWGYAQVHDGADTAIVSASTGGVPSIVTGSHDGSEMGVYCRDGAAIKDRSLLIKLGEYLPVGLTPVLVHLPTPDNDGETRRGRPWPAT